MRFLKAKTSIGEIIKVDNELTEEPEIRRVIRQVCILSSLLLNTFSEAIFEDAEAEEAAGIVVNGVIINNIRYAD